MASSRCCPAGRGASSARLSPALDVQCLGMPSIARRLAVRPSVCLSVLRFELLSSGTRRPPPPSPVSVALT
eukprot:875759-Pyramimonas_sp.AAC.1